MNPTDVILGSVVVIVSTTVLRNARDKKSVAVTWKPVVFGFALCIVLLAIAIPAPGIAKGLALLGLVGAFAVNGPSLFQLVGKLGNAK